MPRYCFLANIKGVVYVDAESLEEAEELLNDDIFPFTYLGDHEGEVFEIDYQNDPSLTED